MRIFGLLKDQKLVGEVAEYWIQDKKLFIISIPVDTDSVSRFVQEAGRKSSSSPIINDFKSTFRTLTRLFELLGIDPPTELARADEQQAPPSEERMRGCTRSTYPSPNQDTLIHPNCPRMNMSNIPVLSSFGTRY